MRPCSRFRFDRSMRMDHDTTQGVWKSTHPLELERHTDVTPTLLGHAGVDTSIPPKYDTYRFIDSDDDRDAIYERLKDLGYA